MVGHYVILFDETGAAYRYYPSHDGDRSGQALPEMVSFCSDLKAMEKGLKDIRERDEMSPELLAYAEMTWG